MRPDTVTEFRLGYAESEYDEEDPEGTLRRTRLLTFGAVRQLNPVAVLSGEIGWKEIEEEWRNLPADPDDERGLTASLSYLRTTAATTAYTTALQMLRRHTTMDRVIYIYMCISVCI